ncbi:MAG: hypothetical protein ABI675_00110 [Chitinophagaceae bacterium]
MKKIQLSIICLLFSVSFIFAQDKIYRQNGKVIEAKIIEVGSGEIKYKEFNNPNGPIYVLESDRIKKIVYENGKEEKFIDNLKDPERYAGQLKNAIKINFFSPLYGYTEFGFERSTGVGKGFEFSVGFIGLGKSERLDWYYNQLGSTKRNQGGAFISGGYKFGKLPNFVLFGKTKMSHIMQGTYAKPILYIGHYKENLIEDKGNSNYEVGKQQVTFGALQIEIGKQWVFGDKVVLDFYYGLGYGIDNKKDSFQGYNTGYDYYENTSAFNYANARVGKSPGLSASFGLKLGLLIK